MSLLVEYKRFYQVPKVVYFKFKRTVEQLNSLCLNVTYEIGTNTFIRLTCFYVHSLQRQCTAFLTNQEIRKIFWGFCVPFSYCSEIVRTERNE